jgi:aerobic-type carbon monoxide dehydrogenase small subunit (CoxS/CutS family)
MTTSVETARLTDCRRVACTVNGEKVDREVPVTELLVDFLREDLGLTGTKRSCDVQVCGVCTVRLMQNGV